MNKGVFAADFSDKFKDVLTDIFGDEFPFASGGIPDPTAVLDNLDLPEAAGDGGPMNDLPADVFDFALPEQASPVAVEATAGAVEVTAGISSAIPILDFMSAIAPGIESMAKKPDGTPGGGPPGGNDGGDDGSDPVLAATYVSGQSDANGVDYFNIQVDFFGAWDSVLMDAFGQAADFLSSVMLGGLTDDGQAWYTFQDPFGSEVYFSVDDILIEAYLPSIDGEGNVLGQAGPYSMRSGGTTDEYTTVVGLMEFDVADATALFEVDNWDAVVLHEMLHVLGFGTLWDNWAVTDTTVDDQGTRRPNDDIVSEVYTGTEGLNVYLAEKDGAMPIELQIETDGGAGTAGGHWDDETYTTELMTGYLYPGTPYLADWTLATLADGGYDVDLASLNHTNNGDNALASGINLEDNSLVNLIEIYDETLIA